MQTPWWTQKESSLEVITDPEALKPRDPEGTSFLRVKCLFSLLGSKNISFMLRFTSKGHFLEDIQFGLLMLKR